MFGKLRDKLKSFIGSKEDSPEKEVSDKKNEETKTPKEPKKKDKQTKEVAQKTAKKETEKEKKKASKKQSAQKKEETPKTAPKSEEKKESIPPQQKAPEQSEDAHSETESEKTESEEQPPKKKGFLAKLFTKETEEQSDDTEQEAPQEDEEASTKSEPEKEESEKQEEGFLKKFTKRLGGETTISEKHVDELFEELELILLENNVALEVVDKIKKHISENLVGTEVKKEQLQEKIIESLKESISSVLIQPPNLVETIKKHDGTYVIVFFGINGSGKTTSIAKLAHKLKSEGISCVLAAGDTFRAAAIQQLETHAERLQLPIIKHDYNADPTAVAFDAKKYAQKNNIKVALIDTAGRMYTKENLVKQMEKIIRVIQPDLKMFVGESITGNDATEQARTFSEAVGIDGIVLSKADVDEKGGTALSVSYITKAPIYFLGVGQNYEDLQDFDKEKILDRLGLE